MEEKSEEGRVVAVVVMSHFRGLFGETGGQWKNTFGLLCNIHKFFLCLYKNGKLLPGNSVSSSSNTRRASAAHL
jgi:hypothetical protein